MKVFKGHDDRRKPTSQDDELLHVADPPLANTDYTTPRCRRRNRATQEALTQALYGVRAGIGDGLVLAVLKKDGGVEYWVAGTALTDPVRGSGAAARLLDLVNRLPAYLSEPFPD